MRHWKVCARTVLTAIVSVGSGSTLAIAEGDELAAPDITLARYYYPLDVQQVEIIVTGARANQSSVEIEIRRQPGTKVLASSTISIAAGAEQATASINVGDFKEGRYVVSAQFKGADVSETVHRVFFRRDIQAAAEPPKPVRLTIRSDGILLANGKPFCPFFACPTDTTSPLAENCFNVEYGEFGLVSNPLKRLKVGLPWVTREDGREFIDMPEEQRMLQRIREIVEAGKSDPSLLCWFMKYESKIPMYRGEKGKRVRIDNVAELTKIHQFIKSIDPDHLTAIEVEHDLGRLWPNDMTPFRDCADILELATRPSYNRELIPGFAAALDEVRKIVRPGKPLLMWIGSSIPSAKYRTAEEIRCATYLALMHGAAGTIYHMGHHGINPTFTRHWSVYAGLSQEVEQLFGVITARRPTNAGITLDNELIDWGVRTHDGKIYLIATNTTGGVTNVTFSFVDHALVPRQVKLLFEGRTIDLNGNEFADTFTAYEPHVYEFVGAIK